MAGDMNPVTQSELLTALDALILSEGTHLEEGDVTLLRLREHTGWNYVKAKAMIKKWVADGKLEPLGKRQKPGKGGRFIDAWRIKTQPPH